MGTRGAGKSPLAEKRAWSSAGTFHRAVIEMASLMRPLQRSGSCSSIIHDEWPSRHNEHRSEVALWSSLTMIDLNTDHIPSHDVFSPHSFLLIPIAMDSFFSQHGRSLSRLTASFQA